MDDTLNPLIRKYIDYGSEEYVKTLMALKRADRKLQSINPYVGVITYPSDSFQKPDQTYRKAVQFQNMTYVGHVEMLLPPVDALSNVGISYTCLSFELDGYVRQRIQVSSGYSLSQGKTFKDFILSKFPYANGEIPFNRHALHVLTDIELTGGVYQAQSEGDAFALVTGGAGSFTPSVKFEFAVSGFKCLLQ
ncbi:MAG TPA: hypothetical protein VHA56_03140 [Mucilaginibacter sp.]|nr:hypothetical protein [Mucilaginibacter sp.]